MLSGMPTHNSFGSIDPDRRRRRRLDRGPADRRAAGRLPERRATDARTCSAAVRRSPAGWPCKPTRSSTASRSRTRALGASLTWSTSTATDSPTCRAPQRADEARSAASTCGAARRAIGGTAPGATRTWSYTGHAVGGRFGDEPRSRVSSPRESREASRAGTAAFDPTRRPSAQSSAWNPPLRSSQRSPRESYLVPVDFQISGRLR